MKIRYTTPNGRLEFEMEVDTGKTAFAVVARIQELFEESECGQCGDKNIRCSVRHIDDYTYYSLVCPQCSAQLNFGQNKDGKGLFVKRKNDDGNEIGKRGWYHWRPRGEEEETPGRYNRQQHDPITDPGEVPFDV